MTLFSELDLAPNIQEALKEKNFLEPTPIQAKVIPQILKSSRDIIAIAQTGTGKTGAFSIPMLSKIDGGKKTVQAVVLSPTRELAMQIAKDIKGFAKNTSGLRTAVVYGGSSIMDQIRDIKRGAQIVVGTPGRMLDLIKRKVLKLNDIKWAILDEADEMLNMGFIEDISAILADTPEDKQTLLFSATMSRTIEKIAQRYMHDSLRIEVKPEEGRTLAIDHKYMIVPAKNRIVALQRYILFNTDMYGIIFCRTKRETQEIGDTLLKMGMHVGILNGDIEQRHRTRIMEAFKRKETNLLVATDVAARGIDVEKLTHVIHIGVPEKIESYTHRSGRTGRAKEKGESLIIANLREHNAIRRIERMKRLKFTEVEVPKRTDLIQLEIENYINMLKEEPKTSALAKKYVDKMMQFIPKDEIEILGRRVLLLAMEEIVSKYPEDNFERGGSRAGGSKKSPRNDRENYGNMKTLVISLGRKAGLTVPGLLGMINGIMNGERIDIGHIQLGDAQSSFDVPPNKAKELCRVMSKERFRGKTISVKEGARLRRERRSSGGRYPTKSSRGRKGGGPRR